MKKHAYISIIVLAFCAAIPLITHARFGIGIATRPYGGKVLIAGKGASAGITCGAQYGPITIAPVTVTPATPYFIRLGTAGAPKTGGWILGNYSAVPNIGTCYNTETGIPIPAFSVSIYGVSQ